MAWGQAAPPVVAPKPPVAPVRAAGSVQASGSGSGRFVVVLDAAHGGEDGGVQLAGSVAEKTVTLAMSVRLRSLLTARGFAVVTTREGNVALEDVARVQVANRAAAGTGNAACISLHATQTGTGVHLYVSSLAPTSATRFLPWKTAQSAYVTRSLKLSSVINHALGQAGAGDAGAVDGKGIPVLLAQSSLPGLDSEACPAVAVEIAPIRGADRKVVTEVTDDQYQTQIVEALAAAMMEWRTDAGGESGGGGQKP